MSEHGRVMRLTLSGREEVGMLVADIILLLSSLVYREVTLELLL